MGMRASLVVTLGGLFVVAACTHSVDGTGTASSGGPSGTSSTSSGSPTTPTTVPLEAARLCKLLVTDCGTLNGTIEDCVRTFRAVRVTPACANKIPGATCESVPDLESTCFPSCTVGTAATCNGDGTVSSCSDDGISLVIACESVCQASGSTWSGECGVTSSKGDVSNDGGPKCWCQ